MSYALPRAPQFRNAAAMGTPPVRLVDTAAVPNTRYMDVSGSVPTFPPVHLLDDNAFKVVVASWSRLNPKDAPTNAFAVDLSQYAPKTEIVTRARLVDVDVPNTQHLIEQLWHRLYFGQGVYASEGCRDWTLSWLDPQGAKSATVVMPLLLDAVTAYTKGPAINNVTFFTQHRAPYPIDSLAAAYAQDAARNCGCFLLAGVPGFPDGFPLYPDADTAILNDSAMSFTVKSAALYAALPDAPDCLPYLYASPVEGPARFGHIVAQAMLRLVRSAQPTPGCDFPFQGGTWTFQLDYSDNDDRFTLSASPPASAGNPEEDAVSVKLSGGVGLYLGFGSDWNLQLPRHRTSTFACGARRFQSPRSYAALQIGDPSSGTVLAAWTQAAFNAYDWGTGFTFDVQFPGEAAVSVAVPGGHMTLDALAAAMTAACAAAGVAVEASRNDDGIVLSSTNGAAFALDFAVDAAFDPARVGYDAKAYPACVAHFPTRPALHIPAMATPCECFPPMSDLQLTYRADTKELVFETVPYAPFAATSTTIPCANMTSRYTVTTSGASDIRHGFRVGAFVALAASVPAYEQQFGFVTEVVDDTTFVMVRLDNSTADFPDDTDVTVIPQDKTPLNLYLQRPACTNRDPSSSSGTFRRWGVTAQTFGFQPVTYSTCGLLTSPGTVDVRQAPYVLLLLGFGQTTPAGPSKSGNVYYPTVAPDEGVHIVFAKVPRVAVLFRPDFDRTYDHVFPGGTPLSYLFVQILNPNGTPYQTHGHDVSVTLAFTSKTNAIEFGNGHVTVPISQNAQARAAAAGAPGGQLYPQPTVFPVGGARASGQFHARGHVSPMGPPKPPVQGGHFGPR